MHVGMQLYKALQWDTATLNNLTWEVGMHLH